MSDGKTYDRCPISCRDGERADKSRPLLFAIMFAAAFVVLLSVMSLCGTGDADADSINYDNIEYQFTSGDTVKIIGSTSEFADLVIPESITYERYDYRVTAIGNRAFVGCKSATLSIPNTVTSIGDYAFHNCIHIDSITIPGSVKSIGDHAFSGCISANTLTLTKGSLTSIGAHAFEGCESIKSLNVPNTVISIGDCAFYGCVSLMAVTFAGSMGTLKTIGAEAFCRCECLMSISIPSGVNMIGNGAFGGCTSIERIDVDKNNRRYTSWYGALYDWYTTELIQYPAGNTTESYTIPATVKTIHDSAFNGCVWLKAINVEPDNQYFCSDDGVLFSKDMTKLIQYPAGKNDRTYYVPDGVVTIGEKAFEMSRNLTTVSLPGSVRTVGEYSFRDGFSLATVRMSDGLETICKGAFCRCEKLRDADLPQTLKTIEEEAFTKCYGLRSVTLPGSVANIKSHAFMYCSGLTSVTFQNGPAYVGEGMFEGCDSLNNVQLSGTVKAILNGAFKGCHALKSIRLPSSVTSISAFAFYDCTALEEINIPEGVATIEPDTFSCCHIKSIELPRSIRIIDDRAFFGCDFLESVVIFDNVQIIGDEAFSSSERLEYVEIGESEKQLIRDHAFMNCPSLKTVVLRGTYKTFKNGVFDGSKAIENIYVKPSIIQMYREDPKFSGLAALLTEFDSSIEGGIRWTFIDNHLTIEAANTPNAGYQKGEMANYDRDRVPWAEYRAQTSVIEIRTGVLNLSDYAFYGHALITDITIPSTIKAVGRSAFEDCTSLRSIALPDGCTDVGSDAFRNCTSLQSAVFGSGVKTIENGTFSGCTALASFSIPGGLTSIGAEAFKGVALTSVTLPNTLTSIGNNAFEASDLGSIVIPDSVTAIGTGTFIACTGLESAVLPNGISAVPDRLFSGCESLRSIVFPDSVTSIGEYAFSDAGLMTAHVPDRITSIGEGAFSGCRNMVAATISDDILTVSKYLFSGCLELESFEVPYSATEINQGAFSGCIGLRDVTLHHNLGCIGISAFEGCQSLSSVMLPGSLTVIASRAFKNCSSIDSITISDMLIMIDYEAFEGCTSLTRLVFEDSAQYVTIQYNSFSYGFKHVGRSDRSNDINLSKQIEEEVRGFTFVLKDGFYRQEEKFDFTLEDAVRTYDGTQFRPDIVTTSVKNNLGHLKEGVDYTISYGTNIYPTESGTVTVSMIGENTVRTGPYSVTKTFEIGTKKLVITGDGDLNVRKYYDGSTAISDYSGCPSFAGKVEGDIVSISVTSVGPYDSADASSERTVQVHLAVTGFMQECYSFDSETYAFHNAVILPRTVSIGVRGVGDKTYDGSTAAAVNAEDVLIYGVLTGDTVSASVGSASFSDPSVGNGKTVTFEGFGITGDDAHNYVLEGQPYPAAANILPATITPFSGSLSIAKEYDGSTELRNVSGNLGLSGAFGADDVYLNIVSMSPYADKNAGADKPITITLALAGEDAGNYVLSSTEFVYGRASITVKPVTITGLGASDRPYDGTCNAAVSGTPVIAGIMAGDDLTVHAGTATFADPYVGSGKTVTFAGFGLEGTDSINYALSAQPAPVAADITKAVISGITDGTVNVTKTYDGTAAAGNLTGALGFTGRIGNDDVCVAVTSVGAYANKNAGMNLNVTLSIALSGTAAANYTLGGTDSYVYAGASISKASVQLNIAASVSEYDGTKTRVLTAGTGVGEENLTMTITLTSSHTGTYAYADGGYALGQWTDGTGSVANYSVTTGSTGDMTVARRNVVLDIAPSQYVFDGLDVRTFTVGTGIGTETLSITATTSSRNAGTYNFENGGYVLGPWTDGTGSAADYSATAGIKGDITLTKKQIVLSVNRNTDYNGENASVIFDYFMADLIDNDVFVSGEIATVGSDVGTYTVKDTEWILSRAIETEMGFGNYEADYDVYIKIWIATGVIIIPQYQSSVFDGTAKTAGQSGSGCDFIYEKITDAAEIVRWYDKDRTPMASAPSEGGEYYLGVSAPATANYTAVEETTVLVRITFYGSEIYALPEASAITYGQKLSESTLSGGSARSCEDGSVLTGSFAWDNGTVILSSGTANCRVVFVPDDIRYSSAYADIAVSVSKRVIQLIWEDPNDMDLVYDKTQKVPSVLISNLVGEDDCTVIASVTVGGSNVNVGSFTFTAGSISGTHSGNYVLPDDRVSGTYTITPRELRIGGLTAESKTYDGTADAVWSGTPEIVYGKIALDDVSAVVQSASFDNGYAGEMKIVLFECTLTGSDAGNYCIPIIPGAFANISKRTVDIRWLSPSDLTYDGTAKIMTANIANLVGTDDCSIASQVTVPGSNVNVGTFTFTATALNGPDADNYRLPAEELRVSGVHTITQKVLTVTGLTAADKVYDGGLSASYTGTPVYSGVCEGDDITVSVLMASFETADVGENLPVTFQLLVSGASMDNYDAVYDSVGHANITRATPTLVLDDLLNGVCQGDNSVTPDVIVPGSPVTGIITVTYYTDPGCTAGATQNAPKDAGTYYAKAVISAGGNYNGAESNVAAICVLHSMTPVEKQGTVAAHYDCIGCAHHFLDPAGQAEYVIPGGGSDKTVIDVTSVVDGSDPSKSSADVDAIIDNIDAVKAADPEAKIVAEIEAPTSAVRTISLESEQVKALADKGASVRIANNASSAEFSTGAIKGMDLTSGSFSFTAKKAEIPSKYEYLIDSSSIAVDLKLDVNGTSVTSMSGTVLVVIPYELPDGADARELRVWYLGDEYPEEFPCTYNPADKTVSFKTTHFSEYAVGFKKTEGLSTTVLIPLIIVAIEGAAIVLLFAWGVRRKAQ